MNSATYAVLFVLHIVALAAAFGPVIMYAVFVRRAVEAKSEGRSLLDVAVAINRRVAFPALVATVLFGFGLIAISEAYAFEQAWVSASMTLALILAAISYFVITPGLERLAKALSEASDSGELKKATAIVRISTGLYQLGFVVIVWLMYAKPGLG